MTVGQPHTCKLIPVIEGNGNQSVLPHVFICLQFGTFNDTLLCHHHQILLRIKLRHLNHRRDFFIPGNRNQVDDIRSLGGSAALGNLIAFQLEHPSFIGQEQNIIMGGGDKHFFYEIFFTLFHSRNTAASALLYFINISRLTFDISVMREGNYTILYRNQIFNIDLSADGLNFGTALIRIFCLDNIDFFLNDTVNQIHIAQNCFIFPYFLQDIGKFLFQLFPVKRRQLSQPHRQNRVCLYLSQPEPLHQPRSGFIIIPGRTNDFDNLVNVILRNFQAL